MNKSRKSFTVEEYKIQASILYKMQGNEFTFKGEFIFIPTVTMPASVESILKKQYDIIHRDL